MERAGRSQRRRTKQTKESEVVDLSSKFGVSFGSDSDSSDAEFDPGGEGAPDTSDEEEEGHSEGGEGGEGSEAGEGGDAGGGGDAGDAGEGGKGGDGGEEGDDEMETDAAKPIAEDEYEYNPLIVRRSNRAIKPTKDIDLYLLGAQFGISVEDSDADSSDMEFAPTKESDGAESVGSSSPSESGSEKSGEDSGANKEEEETTTQSDDVTQSEQTSVRQEVPLSTISFEVPLCAVCLEDSSSEDIVECDGCGISVHEGCYGVPEEDGVDDTRSDLSSFTTIPWFCDTCKAGVKALDCSCMLCPIVGGLFKQTMNGRWVHVVCALYTPGIEYVEPGQLAGVTFDSIPASKWGFKACQLCENERYARTGVVIGCDAGLCKSVFHVTCAQKHGLLCEVENDEKENELCDPYFAQCKQHSLKEVTKRKRRDYLTVMNKQKMFVFNSSDDRIQHYLKLAKEEYGKYFRKMQDYYKAELRKSSEERFLRHVPNALRRLTRKAELLGYTDPLGEVSGDSRKKIAPGLTVEFVNYFHERLNKIKSLEEQVQSLESASETMKVEERQTKEKLGHWERELSAIRSKVTSAQSQVDGLYLIVSRITDNEAIKVPSHLKPEQEVEEDVVKEKPSCEICKESHDTHLMALCDTCNNHYHIGCLDPPLSKVPKKTAKWGWQCHRCCVESGDDLIPTIASFDERSSRSGRKIQAPKTLTYPDNQVNSQKKSRQKRKTKR